MNLETFKNLVDYLYSQLSGYTNNVAHSTNVVIGLYTMNKDVEPLNFADIEGALVGTGKDYGKLFLIPKDMELKSFNGDSLKELEEVIERKNKKIKSLEEHLSANTLDSADINYEIENGVNRKFGEYIRENIWMKNELEKMSTLLQAKVTKDKKGFEKIQEIEEYLQEPKKAEHTQKFIDENMTEKEKEKIEKLMNPDPSERVGERLSNEVEGLPAPIDVNAVIAGTNSARKRKGLPLRKPVRRVGRPRKVKEKPELENIENQN